MNKTTILALRRVVALVPRPSAFRAAAVGALVAWALLPLPCWAPPPAVVTRSGG
jgi:hypothetical protein